MGEYVTNGIDWDPLAPSTKTRMAPWRSLDTKALCCPTCFGTALTYKGVASDAVLMRYLCHGCGAYFRAPRAYKLHILP